MCHLRKCKGHDADVAMRAPRGLQALFREDHTDGGQPTSPAAALRHLPRQDTAAETGSASCHQQELAGKCATIF